MKSRKTPKLDDVTQLSAKMAADITALIDRVHEIAGFDTAERVTALVLGTMIHYSVSRALGPVSADAPTKQDYIDACARLAVHRENVQDAVSAGFGSAMSEFSGGVIEYYTAIKIVPEPTNKNVN